MTNLEWKLGPFQFYLLYYMFEIKHDRRYKVIYISRRNRFKTVNIDVRAITTQNSTAWLMLLASV